MTQQIKVCLLVICLALLQFSCTKLPEEREWNVGDVIIEELPYSDSIPSAWGDLISVSNAMGELARVQLWFQNENGEIRMLRYDILQNHLYKQVRLFQRK